MRVLIFLLALASSSAAASPPDWSAPAPGTYPESMAVTGVVQVDGAEWRGRTDLVAAFVDGEVRGVTAPTLIGGRRIFLLSIGGDSGLDGVLTFQGYDASEDRVLDLQPDVTFDPLNPVGTVPAPLVWTPLADGGPPAWTVNPADFPASMTVTGQVLSGGAVVSESGALVGAFLDGELRGSGPLQGDPAVVSLTVYGAPSEAGDLRFRVYLPSADRTFAVAASVPFATGTSQGARSPVPLPIRPGAFLPGPQGWAMLAAPGASATVATVLGPLWTQGFPGAGSENGLPNVYRYLETDGNYEPVASASETWPRGEGRFVYVFADDNLRTPLEDGGFPKTLPAVGVGSSGSFGFSMTHTPNNGAPEGDGWNLLGNPFDEPLDWDLGWTRTDVSNSVYVWDPGYDGGGYRMWNGSEGSLTDGVIPRGLGFWVQTTSPAAVLRAPAEARVLSAPFQSTTPGATVALRLESQGRPGLATDAWVTFQDGADPGVDGFDAWVLTPLVQDYISLGTASPVHGRLFAVDAREPDPQGLLSIPIAALAVGEGVPIADDLVLTWPRLDVPDAWNVALVDSETGDRVDMRTTREHRFSASASGSVQNANGPEGLATVNGPAWRGDGIQARFRLELGDGIVTSGDQETEADVRLDVPRPNPSHGLITVTFSLREAGDVRLGLYDVLGRRVADLVAGPKAVGSHTVEFDGRHLSVGAYSVRLDAAGAFETSRMVIVR